MVLFPNDSVDIKADASFNDQVVALEPRCDSVTYRSFSWPTHQLTSVCNGTVRLINNTDTPVKLSRNDHLCQIRGTNSINVSDFIKTTPRPKKTLIKPSPPYSKQVVIDPNNQLTSEWRNAFQELNSSYDSVFENKIGRYNDRSGKVRARINISSSKPPTRKLRVPNYCKNNLDALQEKFDELEAEGVFARPEDFGVIVEHVSPSFLVEKSSGGHRLVTNFTSLIDYCKTLPTVMPTVENVLQTIGAWKYLIISDLRDAFYQIPMDRGSMKWCATPTPYRGLRIYAVAVQGLPGSSEVLEEMLCAVLGEFVKQGFVAKIADDLSVGGDSIEELYLNWSRVLEALALNGLKLKALKTIIAPTIAQILGWMWNNGTITASVHKISPLTSCSPPETVTALRSYVGSFKVFNRIVRGCAGFLNDLEKFMSGKKKNEKLTWNDAMLEAFKSSQASLSHASVITLPHPSDQLIIVHDGSKVGIGSVLYLRRGDVTKLGGFFSAKLKVHQQLWYPCEIEALSIAASVSHFSPYIVQSHHRTQVLTDNRPCVQAWVKMKRGEFSSSARVGTFMSMLSQYDVDVQFIKGEFNLPSDFQSRHPPLCEEHCCQICKFVELSENVVVRKTSVERVLAGHEPVPFATRSSWKNIQLECPDLRRVHAHLSQGTRPTAKKTKSTVVKRFLRNAKIARDGLLVVKQARPFLPETELIVVPLSLLHGLLTSLHLQLDHPTATQLTNVFNRNYFSLNVNDCINHVLQSCSQCQALKTIPVELHEQSSTPQTTTIATDFAADIIRRYRQKIFIMRETLSSFTLTSIVDNEQEESMRSAIIEAVSSIRANSQTCVTVRADNAPGLASLHNDFTLKKFNIFLEYGRIHNKNKNPVVEKAIQELGAEMLKFSSEGGPFSASELAYITNVLNSRLRHHGLSSWEIIYQRNQFTGDQIDISDLNIAERQLHQRVANQQYSAKCKSRGRPSAELADIQRGSLVYIKEDGDKNKARERFLVTKIVGDSCTLQKIAKSQFRSKPYQLKLSEVYPVTSDIPAVLDYFPADSDSDSEDSVIDRTDAVDNLIIETPSHTEKLNNNPVPDVIDVPPVEEQSINYDGPVVEGCDVVASLPEAVDVVSENIVDDRGSSPCISRKKSSRTSKPPNWMVSGDFVLEKKKKGKR